MTIQLLVGHRGVGKSSLLQKLKVMEGFAAESLGAKFYDLDREVELAAKKSVSEIFESEGESSFRDWETNVLRSLLTHQIAKTDQVFVALGAGFHLKEFLSNCDANIKSRIRVLWVQRLTDSDGRIFLNRPRLDQSISPIEESLEAFSRREPVFYELSDERLVLREGEFASVVSEEDVFFPTTPIGESATRTIFESDLKLTNEFFNRRTPWGFSFYELRTDLLSFENIRRLLQLIPEDKVLISIRKPKEQLSALELDQFLKELSGIIPTSFKGEVDWDVVLGAPEFKITSLSSHNAQPPSLNMFPGFKPSQENIHLKWAPLVDEFHHFVDGHLWWTESPNNRSFLPRSEDGRWVWYRQFQKGKVKYNFVREDRSQAHDQPTLLEWMATPHQPAQFCAVLGRPLKQSWSPVFHEKFCYPSGMPFLRIQLSEEELSKENLDFLIHLGLRAAAVTSPLKAKAFDLAEASDAMTKKTFAVNTLKIVNGKLFGTNTDIKGLQLFKPKAKGKVAVWGRGKLAESLKLTFPEAQFYSARDGAPADSQSPDVLVWSAPRSSEVLFPPEHWQPKIVLDLNYGENSMGKEYALIKGVEYLNGTGLFMVQAQNQQLYWSGI